MLLVPAPAVEFPSFSVVLLLHFLVLKEVKQTRLKILSNAQGK